MDKSLIQEIATRLAQQLRRYDAPQIVQRRFEDLCLLGMKDVVLDSLKNRGAAAAEEMQVEIQELENRLFQKTE
jgi:hypothetical protein